MPIATDCPAPEVLQAFLLGRLADDQADRLAAHVEHCARCVTAAHAVQANDELLKDVIEAVHTPTVPRDESTDALLENLMARLCQLAAPSGDTRPSALPGSSDPADPDVTQEAYPFLAPAQQPDEIGRLGAFRVHKVLGAGGMGVVFQAEDTGLHRQVALKVLRPRLQDDASARQRFLREAQAAAGLAHDHIMPILHIGEDGGMPYLVMPLLIGETLEQRLKREPRLGVAEVLRFGGEIAAGLAAAHERGFIHRDIKPSNIWLEGGPPACGLAANPQVGRVKILDFGLARLLGSDAALTHAGAIVGTPAYMAPEQARGEALDARCDLFSLGCVMYRMATGTVPFPGATTMATLRALELVTPKAPHVLQPAVPRGLSVLIVQLLAKRPDQRLPSARAVLAALATVRIHAPQAVVAPSRRRQRAVAAAILGILVAAVVCVILVAWRPWRGGDVQDPVEQLAGVIAGPPTDLPRPPPAAWPIDSLRRDKIAAYELAVAGNGDPNQAPAELVGILGDSRLKHWDTARAIAYSPDGKTLASASYDGTAKLWDTATGKQLRLLDVHERGFQTVAYADAGRILLTMARDGSAKLWDTRSWKELHALKVDHGGRDINWADLSPGGKLLATTGWDFTVKVWEVASRQKLADLVGHRGLAHRVLFHDDGKMLVTAGADGTVRLWDAATGTEVQNLGELGAELFDIAFSADHSVLAVGAKDGRAFVWDTATWKQRPLRIHTKGQGNTVMLRQDGKVLAIGNSEHTVTLWDTATGKLQQTLSGHHELLCHLQFQPGSAVLASASLDGVVKFWDTDTGKELLDRRGHQSFVRTVAFSPDGQFLLSGSWDGTIKVWYPATGKELQTLRSHAAEVRSLAFHPGGRQLASGSRDTTVKLWEVGTWKARTLGSHTDDVRSVAFNRDGSLLASGSADRTVKVWDPVTGRDLKTLPGHFGHVNSVAFAGDLLVSFSADKTLKFWDPASGDELQALRGHLGWGEKVVVRPDGAFLASASSDRTVKLWDAKTGADLRTLTGHQDAVCSVAFAPKVPWQLASCGYDGSVRLWDSASGKQTKVWQLAPAGSHVLDVVFSPDGRHLASANGNGTIYILRLPE